MRPLLIHLVSASRRQIKPWRLYQSRRSLVGPTSCRPVHQSRPPLNQRIIRRRINPWRYTDVVVHWSANGPTELSTNRDPRSINMPCYQLSRYSIDDMGEIPISSGFSPLKIKISKIGLRSDLSWPKLGLEPKFHEPGTFGGFGKREQTDTQDSCFISIDW